MRVSRPARCPAAQLGAYATSGFATSTGAGSWGLQTTGANAYQLVLVTVASRFATTPTILSFNFSSGAATGVQKITVQTDLTAGVVTAFVNGTQVAVTGSTLPANSTLNENQYYPFSINSYATTKDGSTNVDFALYGLCVSRSIRYANNGTGQAQIPHPQFGGSGGNTTLVVPGSPTGGTFTITYGGVTSAPISAPATAATIQSAMQAMSSIGSGNVTVSGGSDTGGGIEYQITNANGFVFTTAAGQCDGSSLTGPTIKDNYRYFPAAAFYPYTRDLYGIGYLALTENPSTAPRHMVIRGGSQTSGVACDALFLNNGANGAIAGSNLFTDLVLYTGGSYGMPLQLGHVIDTRINGVTAQGGICGAGNLSMIANYTVRIKNCKFTGADSNYFAAFSITKMEDINFPGNGRYCIKSFDSTLNVQRVFVGNYGNDTCAFAELIGGNDGSTYSFDDILLDFEGGGSFQRCLLYCENSTYTPTTLKVNNINGGAGGFNSVFKLLCGANPPVGQTSYIDIQNSGADMFGSLIDVDGGLWIGTVKNTNADLCSFVTSAQTYGRPQIQVTDERSYVFPRYGTWFAGTTKIRPRGIVDGQYRELLVGTDGTHGSTTPPSWAGNTPIQANPASSLAAYGIDHTAIAATLSGQASSNGYLTNPARKAEAQTLFGGPVAGKSTKLTITGTGTGGTFTLSYGGQTTSGIAYNASASTVQSALQGLSSVGSGNMTVSGNNGGPYTITLAGTLANLAGGILGLTVDGTNLTSTGPVISANTGNTVVVNFAGVTGGTFTLTGSGNTTSAIAWNATAPTVQAAILAANIPTSYGVPYLVPTATPGVQYVINAGVTINTTSLTGGATATLASSDIPQTWYVGLSTTGAHPAGSHYLEPYAGITGYARVAIGNNTTNFDASSAGAKTSGTSITFPTATGPYQVQSIMLFPSATANTAWATIQLASPLNVATSATPTISSGNLTFTHTPYPTATTGAISGGKTDYAWGKCYDLIFGGTTFTPPATWYAALSTAAVSKTTTTLTEPSGYGYGRVSLTSNTTNWLVGQGNDTYRVEGSVVNALTLAFGSPTGSWGSCVAAALSDASSSGNTWFVAPLVSPVSPVNLGPAPTFAANAFTLAVD